MSSWTRTYASIVASASATVIAAVTAVWIDTREARGQVRYQCGDERLTDSEIAAKFGVTVDKLHRAHYYASVTNEIFCTMTPEHRAKALRKADQPKPDHPGEAMEFRNMFLRSEDGTIPDGALMQAKAELDALRGMPDMVASAAGVTSGSWTWLGPGNIGGRVRTIIINPSAPATMLLGSVSGGIWRTTNSGDTWAPVQDFMGNLAVSTMVANPLDFNVQYAGTGEGFYNADGIRGAGVFKSTNGGLNWTQLGSTTTANFLLVNRLAISPDGATLLAATRTGIFRSTDGGVTFPAANSLPGGAGDGVTDVDFHPSNSNLAIASGYLARVWYSTDGGNNWIAATGLPMSTGDRVEVAYSNSNPNVVYAAVDNAGGQLYKSVNEGVSYTLIPDGAHPNWLGGQGWYDNALFVDPSNENFLIVGGLDLYKSTDGGATLVQISRWDMWPFSAHADHHVIIPKIGFNGTSQAGAYFGNDGGIYSTTNIYTVGNNGPNYTNGWLELNNNLGITQFYGAGAHEASGKVMGGTQDNGTLTYTTAGGTEGWAFEFGGDGGFSAIDQTNADYCYGEYIRLQIHRSTTGCGAGSGSYIFTGIGDAGSAANFIAPFILDPNNQARLLAGGRSLWRTNDARTTPVVWASIKDPNAALSNISAIAVQQGNADHIWVGHNNGDVFKTLNGTAATPTWNPMDTGLPNNRVVTRIAVDKNNPLIVYATFSGFALDNVWKSVDGGASWTNIQGTIPATPVRSIAIHPNNSNWLYLGTEIGIFTSENAGATWTIPHDGPANVSVDEVFFSGSTLYAATHGRGVYKAGTATPVDPVPGKVTLISPSNIYTGDTTPTYRWNSDPFASFYQLWVNDSTGTRITQWYTEAELGCVAGGVCAITPAVALTVGAAEWWVQTWNPQGFGPWSDSRQFDSGWPRAQIVSTYAFGNIQPGYSAPLWIQVRNTGTFALPAGAQAWWWVTGPGISDYVGFLDLSSLAPSTDTWYVLNWDVPIGQAPGTHTYWGRIWNGSYGGWNSNWSMGQTFNVLATPATAARIVSTYPVSSAVRGSNARFWALVRNVGSSTLNARVWFNVHTVGSPGFADVAGLPSGQQGWYFFDWLVPGSEPVGPHWYLAQAWDNAGATSLSPTSEWQAFTVTGSAPNAVITGRN